MENCKPSLTPMLARIKLTFKMLPHLTLKFKTWFWFPMLVQFIIRPLALTLTLHLQSTTQPNLLPTLNQPTSLISSVYSTICKRPPNMTFIMVLLTSFPFGCIIGRCDENWVSDVQTQKFISRYVLIFGKGIMSSKYQKQQLMALPSTKVEYIVVVVVVKKSTSWRPWLLITVTYDDILWQLVLYCLVQRCKISLLLQTHWNSVSLFARASWS